MTSSRCSTCWSGSPTGSAPPRRLLPGRVALAEHEMQEHTGWSDVVSKQPRGMYGQGKASVFVVSAGAGSTVTAMDAPQESALGVGQAPTGPSGWPAGLKSSYSPPAAKPATRAVP